MTLKTYSSLYLLAAGATLVAICAMEPYTPREIYPGRADSVVRIERFESPRLTIEILGMRADIRFPWSHRHGHGSGVIISKKGHILTAGHGAAGCSLFLIKTKGGQVYEAGILAIDNDSDLALLQPVRGGPRGGSVARPYPYASIGDSVVHVGCPLGFDWLLSKGVVSLFVDDLLISDTVVNPGSSGGALFNSSGRLIGIVSMIFSPIPAYTGHSAFVGPAAIQKFLSGWGF